MFSAVHDLHNPALRFKILAMPNPPTAPKVKGKWNFSYEGRSCFLTDKWLVIYNSGRNKVPLRDLPQTADTIVQGMVNLALQISRRYNLTIDPTPIPFSSNRPEIKTPYTSSTNYIEKEAKAVYPVPSPIELTGPNAVGNAMNLTEMLALQLEATKLEIANKIKHDAVLEGMLSAQRADNKLREEMSESLRKITAQKPSIFSIAYKFLNKLYH
jgi:hypothetical protein